MKQPLRRRMHGRRRGRTLRWFVSLAFLTVALAWSAGFLVFIRDIPRGADAAGENAPPYDAVVVLTGGSGRLEAGLDLLAAGQAKKLFVSGVYHGVDVAALLQLSQTAPRNLDCCIVLGYAADDTTGNAAETATWMRAEGFRSLLLVTANYHLPRSRLEFAAAMPEIAIAVWPVHPATVQIETWWLWPGTAKLLAGEYTKYLAAHVRIWLRSLRSDRRPAWLP